MWLGWKNLYMTKDYQVTTIPGAFKARCFIILFWVVYISEVWFVEQINE